MCTQLMIVVVQYAFRSQTHGCADHDAIVDEIFIRASVDVN